MGIIGFVGRRVGNIAGVDAIKGGAGVVGALGKQIFSKVCRKCGRGRLTLREDFEVDGKIEHHRMCHECGYSEPVSGPTEREFSELREEFETRLAKMSDDDFASLLRSHRFGFRFYFAVAVVEFGYAVYAAVTTGRGGVVLPVSGFGLLFLAMALKSSYRHWQLEERRFFAQGALRAWWRGGRWMV